MIGGALSEELAENYLADKFVIPLSAVGEVLVNRKTRFIGCHWDKTELFVLKGR